MYKAEIQEENGLWHDVRGADGKALIFATDSEAHAKLAEMFPVMVKMEKFGGDKRTRVVAVLKDDDDK